MYNNGLLLFHLNFKGKQTNKKNDWQHLVQKFAIAQKIQLTKIMKTNVAVLSLKEYESEA